MHFSNYTAQKSLVLNIRDLGKCDDFDSVAGDFSYYDFFRYDFFRSPLFREEFDYKGQQKHTTSGAAKLRL